MKKIIVIISLLSLCSCVTANPKPWTNGEKAVLVWSTLAAGADAYTTCRYNDNPNNYEMNPLLGRHPSDQKVIVFLSISQFLSVAFSHWFSEIELPLIGKVNTRYGLLGTKATLNTYFTIRNSQLDWEEK